MVEVVDEEEAGFVDEGEGDAQAAFFVGGEVGGEAGGVEVGEAGVGEGGVGEGAVGGA
ncbi:hypothetical protein NORO109296_21690 [Nocardiopsis rhodophaea]